MKLRKFFTLLLLLTATMAFTQTITHEPKVRLGNTPASVLNDTLIGVDDTGLIVKSDKSIGDVTTQQDVFGANAVMEGGVVHLENYDYYVWASRYIIDGVYYEDYAEGNVTLAAADPTNDRIDVFYIQNDGLGAVSVGAVTGTPAVNPLKPTLNSTLQSEISFDLVQSNTTSPGDVTTSIVYDENLGTPSEWQNTLTPLGGFNPAYAVDQYNGSLSIELSTINSFGFTGSTEVTVGTDTYINFAIKLSDWAGSTELTLELYSAAAPINKATINRRNASNYGLDISLTTWQFVSIPITAFVDGLTNFDEIRFVHTNFTAPVLYDYIFVQSGSPGPIVTAQTFLELTDTPDTYSGQNGKAVTVNSTEDGLQFTNLPSNELQNYTTDGFTGTRAELVNSALHGFMVDKTVSSGRVGYDVVNSTTGTGGSAGFFARSTTSLYSEFAALLQFPANYSVSYLRNRGAVHTDRQMFFLAGGTQGFSFKSGANIGTLGAADWTTDVFTIQGAGEVIAPKTDNAGIDAEPTGKVLLTREYFEANSGMLEKVGTGYMLRDRQETFHGTVGLFALDLTRGQSVSTTRGATATGAFASGVSTTASGQYSFVTGRLGEAKAYGSFVGAGENIVETTGTFGTAVGGTSNTVTGYGASAFGGTANAASGNYSTVIGGTNNTSYSYAEFVTGMNATTYSPTSTIGHDTSDRAFTVGIGATSGARADGLRVWKDGSIDFPDYGSGNNTGTGAYNLNVDASGNIIEGGLPAISKINEGNGDGFVIDGRSAANYGNVGLRAVDLSYSSSVSSTRGATGQQSFAIGENVTASGIYSVASGFNNVAAGGYAIAIGVNNDANNINSFALGNNNTSNADRSFALGYGNTTSGQNSFALGIENTAHSWSEIVVGMNATNYVATDANAWNVNDRAFTVGIGLGTGTRADGFRVWKDGTVDLPDYGVGNNTGTATRLLAVDASGNVIEEQLVTQTIEVNIGDWDMDTNPTVTVAHGLSATEWKTVRNLTYVIRNDADNLYHHDDQDLDVTIDATNFGLERVTGGDFDGIDYDATTYNRGFIDYTYTPD